MGNARETVDRFYEMFAAGKISESASLFSPDCITAMPTGRMNQVEHEQMGQAFKAAFPDSYMAIDHTVEAGADVVVLGHFRGTHGGDLVSPGGTIPASGNDLNLRFIDYFKVENGVIVDHQTVFDQMEMLGQLGALPPA